MQEFSTFAELAATVQLPVDPSGRGFRFESDWLMDGSGLGLSGGHGESRWLVTFAHSSSIGSFGTFPFRDGGEEDLRRDGWLVAYAIGHDGTRHGRCLLLGGPWSPHEDHKYLEAVRQQPWWGKSGNVETLAAWLQSWQSH